MTNVVSISAARTKAVGRGPCEGLRALVRHYRVACGVRPDDAMWFYKAAEARYGSGSFTDAQSWIGMERIEAALPPCPGETDKQHRERLIAAVRADIERVEVRDAADSARRFVEEYLSGNWDGFCDRFRARGRTERAKDVVVR
jgi:hypothetical protein